MESSTRAREEWLTLLAAKGIDRAAMGDPPAPLVEVVEQLGCYAIRNTIISYCPWCGAKLPSVSLEELKKRGKTISIEVDWAGNVTRDESP